MFLIVGEERADASPVPPTLAKNASARAFSMSSLLKRDNDPSSQVNCALQSFFADLIFKYFTATITILFNRKITEVKRKDKKTRKVTKENRVAIALLSLDLYPD